MSRLFFLAMLTLITACVSETNGVREPNPEVQKISTARINAQLGMAYLRMNDVSRAKTKLLAALSQAPGIPEPWYAMGYFMEKTGNLTGARANYLKAMQIAPKRGDVQNNYGTFLCRTGQYREAIKHFLLASRDPHYLTPADAFENAGLCALKIPDNRLATAYFQKAIAADPNRSDSLLELARLGDKNDTVPETKTILPRLASIAGSHPIVRR